MFEINSKYRINLVKTLIFNFVFFPLRYAIRFPVLIWGKFKIDSFKGKIVLLHEPHFGMLKLGISDPVRSFGEKSFFSLHGLLILGDNVVIRKGMRILVKEKAELILSDNVYIGDCNTIISKKRITIGEATRIGNNTVFMDTDFHYIINTDTGIVKDNNKDIYIGENNWIGGNCIIKKGAVTPKGTILAGPFSMINKNYVGKINENLWGTERNVY